MTEKCKNCKQNFKGKFCNHCGQSADTHDISFHFLWHDIQHGLLHFDKGIFYTIKQLFTRPGFTIRDFIEGQRVKHFKPISMMLVLAAIYSFLFNYFDIAEKVDTYSNDTNIVSNWARNHYALSQLIFLPVFSFSSYLVFKKSNYNYVKHIVLNAYIVCQGLIINIFLFPLYFLGDNSNLKPQFKISLLFIMIIWTYSQFFTDYSKQRKILLSFLCMFLSIIFIILIASIYAIIITHKIN